MSGGHIYILGSHTGTLYIGVTSNLYLRIMQHEGGRKAPNSMDKISTAGVLRLRATKRCVTR
jgi:predicted GIY-YIG superfamily endonuclease